MTEFWTVPKMWPGETVVVIASGPSLDPLHVEFCRGRARVIVVNDSYKLAPWAEALYACDLKWWRWHDGVPDFKGLRVTMDVRAASEYPGLLCVRRGDVEGLAAAPDTLNTGRNSTYQALGLARHAGAARIILLGVDMRFIDGKTHWFGDHPRATGPEQIETWLKAWPSIVKTLADEKIEVINCTPGSMLNTFPRGQLANCL